MKINFKNKYIYLTACTVFICTAAVIYFQMPKKVSDPDDRVVAKIGDMEITVRDLKMNYEFGLAHLKAGNTLDKKRLSYLNLMIGEKIIALEGYKYGLDKTDKVKEQCSKLNDELMIEALLDEAAVKNIFVSEQEIKDAIIKSKVSFKFSFWVEPTYERAVNASIAMQKMGYHEFVKTIIKNNPEFKINPSLFETGYVTWKDISEETLAAITDLKIGEISKPVLINNSYFLFQVQDIRRNTVLESDYLSQGPSVKKILYNKKLMHEVTKYVEKFMAPKNLTTKGKAFRALANASLEWKKDSVLSKLSFKDALYKAGKEKSALYSLKQCMTDTMVKFNGGFLNISQFLNVFDPDGIGAAVKGDYEYKAELNNNIALKMRDYLLEKEAIQENITLNARQENELKNWKDKWVYQELRDKYLSEVKISEDDAVKFFNKNKNMYKVSKINPPDYKEFNKQAKRDAYILKASETLNRKIDSLKGHYDVKINYDVLNTVELTESKKSHWMSFQLYKGGTNRLVVPIVDAAWKYLN